MGKKIPFEFEYKKCYAQQKTRKKKETQTVIELVCIFVYACF